MEEQQKKPESEVQQESNDQAPTTPIFEQKKRDREVSPSPSWAVSLEGGLEGDELKMEEDVSEELAQRETELKEQNPQAEEHLAVSQPMKEDLKKEGKGEEEKKMEEESFTTPQKQKRRGNVKLSDMFGWGSGAAKSPLKESKQKSPEVEVPDKALVPLLPAAEDRKGVIVQRGRRRPMAVRQPATKKTLAGQQKVCCVYVHAHM